MVFHCHPLTLGVMEVMGTDLDIPLSNEATIKACLDIYERWFVSKESQPEPIAHNIVAYRDVVVGQLSLIITPPPASFRTSMRVADTHCCANR